MALKILIAFLVGGFLSSIAQIFIDKTSFTPAKILVGFVVFGVFLGAVGLYEPLINLFGCGVSVPLLGFGGNVAKGVRDAVIENGFLGAIGGALKSAGIGLGFSLLLGVFFSLFFKGKSKRL
jgi:stage V sporulation protein AE